jgi:hypothetical protein
MTLKDDDLPALKELETAITEVWNRNPDMTDYVAARAYEAAFTFYRARLRGREAKAPSTTGVESEAITAIRLACEKILTSGPAPMKGLPRGNIGPVPLEKLVDYLRELERSVQRHTRTGGRQGYLQFVRGYLS